MAGETPVLAGVTEAATGDIESANFCGDDSEREEHDRRNQNRQRTAIQESEYQSERTDNFQPWNIERQRDTNGPGQNFEIVDVPGEICGVRQR